MKSDIHFDAIKIMLLTTTQGTVCTKPLRMCSFLTQLKLFSFKLATLIKLYKLLKNSRCIKVSPNAVICRSSNPDQHPNCLLPKQLGCWTLTSPSSLTKARTICDKLLSRFTLKKIGGGDRTRTRYLLLAKQPLSQLSYTPKTRRTLDFFASALGTLQRYAALWSTFAWAPCHLPTSLHPSMCGMWLGGSGWSRTNDPCVINTVL